LTYSTYLGGSGSDRAYGIAVDGQGNAYVTGDSTSTDFPIVGPLTLQPAAKGQFNAFFTKLALNSGPPDPATAAGGSPSILATYCRVTSGPVNCATGDLWLTSDLTIPGRGIPLRFTHTYNSQLADQDGPLGFGWTHSYNMFLTADSAGN